MNKAIYMPKGKAGEYAKYACNFFVGCSNNCSYCYCKRGLLGHAMGKPEATLKKCFKDEKDALDVFRKELIANLDELKKNGLFFTFTSDPLLPETRKLTINAVNMATSYWVPCMILTKCADFIDYLPGEWCINENYRKHIAFGFTLTGHDELEPGASTNKERIKAMHTLNRYGFKTFASIEPIITPDAALDVINSSLDFCDLYKIGILSGKRKYTPQNVIEFLIELDQLISFNPQVKVYLKDSILDFTKTKRDDLQLLNVFGGQYVDADHNMFND